MARGHQKIQSQQKNAKKQAEIKKSKGHDQKTAAKAALVFKCGVCRVSGNYSRLFLPQQIILRCSFQPSFNTHLWQIALFELNCIHFGHLSEHGPKKGTHVFTECCRCKVDFINGCVDNECVGKFCSQAATCFWLWKLITLGKKSDLLTRQDKTPSTNYQ